MKPRPRAVTFRPRTASLEMRADGVRVFRLDLASDDGRALLTALKRMREVCATELGRAPYDDELALAIEAALNTEAGAWAATRR